MTDEQLTIQLLNRLFWLITQTPGVARYESDVRLFEGALLKHNLITREQYERTVLSHSKP